MLTRTLVLFSLGLAAVLFGAAQTEAQPGKKGPKGFGKGGPGAGPDIQRLESNIDRLIAELEEAKGQLARAKEASRAKKGGFEGKGKGKGKGGEFGKKEFAKKEFGKGKGKGKGGEFGKKEGFKKEFAKGPGGWGPPWARGGFGPMAGKGPGGFGPMAGKGFEAKMSPEVIKERYEFFKKLYDESKRETARGGPKGKGKGGFGQGFEGKKKDMFGGRGFGPMGGARGGAGADSIDARLDRLTRELDALRSELKKKKR